MKKIFFLVLFLFSVFFVSFISETKKKKEYQDANVKCFYETTQNRLNGSYISYYPNGQKKAEGNFENNCRSGKWTAWDSTGRLRAQRVYENPFVVKRIVPKIPKEKPIELLNISPYSLIYNSDGYIQYSFLSERMVVWSKRLWRVIEPKDNPILFENNYFFNVLSKNIANKKLTKYKANDDVFSQEDSNMVRDTSIKIIGYKIKEDFFFDNDRLVSETRIIGICPVEARKNDTLDLYWVYFPELRKCTALEKIQQNNIPKNIKTLDDLFFFRYFYGRIYKATNVYDRLISDYKQGEDILKESERIDIGLIEQEHDIWISMTE